MCICSRTRHRTRQRILAEARSHEQESLRLRSLLNTHAHVNRTFPPEILSVIFVHYATIFQQKQFARFSATPYYEPGKYLHKQIYTWLKVAHVCRHWREVALQCAPLWSFLVIDERVPGDVLRKFLMRSQGMPLTVIAHAVHQDRHCGMCVRAEDAFANLDAGAVVLEEAVKRATKLKLYLWGVNYAVFWNRLTGPASKLTSLHIEAVGEDKYENYLHPRAPPVVIPKELFNEHRPPLRFLSFTAIGMGWSNVLMCASVRKLTITSCMMYSDLGTSANLGDLLGALRRMPNVEVFAIDAISLPESDVVHYNPVDLPRLQQIRVPFARRSSLNLALHLRLPPDAMIYFTGREAQAHSPDFMTQYTEGIPHLMGGLQTYAMAYDDDHRAENCQVWARAPQPLAPSPSPDASAAASAGANSDPTWDAISATRPRLRFDCTMGSNIFKALMAGLDTQHVRVLSFAQHVVGRRDWLDAFASLTAVHTLRMQGEVALGIGAGLARWKRPAHMGQVVGPNGRARRCPNDYDGFGELLDDNSVNACVQDGYTPGPLPFPHLRTLRIANADFPLEQRTRERGYVWRRRVRGFDGPYGVNVAGLVKGLRVRAERGAAQVTRIDLEECQCWERQRLAPLVGTVNEVWWNGRRLAWDDLGEQITAPVRKMSRVRVIAPRYRTTWGSEDDD